MSGDQPVVEKFEDGPIWTVGYLVFDPRSKEGVVIDVPMWSAEKIYRKIRTLALSISNIVLTHGHWDHIGDAAKLRRLTGSQICADKADEWMMLNPNGMVIPPPEKVEPVKVDVPFMDGSRLSIGAHTFEVLHTPGHSAGSICLYEKDAGILFTGDTLFAGSIGRVDLPTGSMDEISKSISEKIMMLPGDVKMYPGHGQESTILKEKDENQFVRMMLAEK
jgi:hydroxyacylglutathione hydrolase